MSNQSNDGFQGSQPFITDKQYQNLSLAELKHILEEEKESLKKNYKELDEKQKIIKDIKKLQKLNEKVKQGIDIVKERKKSKIKKTSHQNDRLRPKPKKIKSFDEYFEQCIKNKEIPKDTPPYLREALERSIKEYEQGIEKEKSAFENFAVKYIIRGDPGISPVEFFNRVYKTLEDFFTNHRNIKFGMVLVCLMEQQTLGKKREVVGIKEDKGYFNSGTHEKS